MRRSTGLMGSATLLTILAAYLFQVIGGRSLGAVAFVPVTSTWTIFFIAVTVVLLPLEQAITRRIALGVEPRLAVRHLARPILSTAVGLVVLGVVVVAGLLDTGFASQSSFLWLVPLLFLLYLGLAVGRGMLAGGRRFAAYAFTIAAEGVTRVGAVAFVAVVGGGAAWYVVAMCTGALPVLMTTPWRSERGESPDVVDSVRGFLVPYVVAQAASQTILAGGTLLVAWMGAPAAAVSSFFVTTTLFRGPLTASYQMLARFLPGISQMAVRKDPQLRRMVNRIQGLGAVGLVLAGIGGTWLGPGVIAWLYGTSFQPSRLLAGMIAAGVGAAIVAMFLGQVIVGSGHTRVLALDWWVGMAAGVLAVLLLDLPTPERVAAGFLVAELVAASMVARSTSRLLKD